MSNFRNMASSAEFPHTFFVSEKNNESFVTYSDTSSLIIQLGYILHSAVIPPPSLIILSSSTADTHSLFEIQAMFKVHTKLRVLALVRDEEQVPDETERLAAFLCKSRVKADSKVHSPSFLFLIHPLFSLSAPLSSPLLSSAFLSSPLLSSHLDFKHLFVGDPPLRP